MRSSHVAPGGDAPLVDAVGQVDELAVVVRQAAEGLVHALTAQSLGYALVQLKHTQQKELGRHGGRVTLPQSGVKVPGEEGVKLPGEEGSLFFKYLGQPRKHADKLD